MADPQGEYSPAKGASPRPAVPKKAARGSRARPAKTSLQARLRERERQVGELSEQCLHFLDLLQAARQKSPDLALLEKKVRKLEEVLADSRRRVRNSRTVLIPGQRSSETRQLEIAVWPSNARAVDLAEVSKLARRVPKTPVTCICPVEGTPEVPAELPANLQILAAECGTAAEFWNTTMASTESPGVLFLAAGTELQDGAIEVLEAIQDDVLALGHPRLVRDDGEETLGLQDTDLFQFQRVPVAPDQNGLVDLDFIPPEAFFLRREAFHVLGPFDEDLLGHLALVDYCLRARQQSFRLVGVSDARVRVPDRMDLVTKDERTERDRLVLLARHRPGEVAEALTGMDLFWSLPLNEREGFLRALFMRLPGANLHSEALAMLVKEALILVRRTVPRPLVERSLSALQKTVESSFELGPEIAPPAPGASGNVDPIGAVRHRFDTLRTTLDQLRVQVETERNAHKNLLEQLISEIKGERQANQELSSQLQTDRSSRQALEQELETARSRKDELEASLRGELDDARGRSQELESRLQTEIERGRVQEAALEKTSAQRKALEESVLAERAQVAGLTEDIERLTGEVEAQRRTVEQLGSRLKAEQETAQMLRAERDTARQTAQKLQAERDTARQTVQKLQAERDAARRTAQKLQAERDAERRTAQKLQAERDAERQRERETRRALDDALRTIAEALSRNGERDATALARCIREVRGDLQKRNYWVTLLLQEIGRWRLKPFPRKLSTDERKFLEAHGRDDAE